MSACEGCEVCELAGELANERVLTKQLTEALRIAYPYALDAETFAETEALRKIAHADMVVISAARKAAEARA